VQSQSECWEENALRDILNVENQISLKPNTVHPDIQSPWTGLQTMGCRVVRWVIPSPSKIRAFEHRMDLEARMPVKRRDMSSTITTGET
jgi:hypothetical protein